MNKKILSLCLLIMTSVFSYGADFQKGLDASENGDFQTAYNEFHPLALDGDSRAQYLLGVMYANGSGVLQDLNEAAKWHRLAAEQGQVYAQYFLGILYATGQGVLQDLNEAAKWYRLAAEQGSSEAQYNLGVYYYSGHGVAQDNSEAVRWFRLAAEQGHIAAQYNLGIMYSLGQGVAQDNSEAVRWFRLAAEQGHSVSQMNLGTRYVSGRGVTKDYSEAAKFFRLAAEQGDSDAQYNLGVMYQYGQGVAQDYSEAEKWYRLAADQGNSGAKELLASLKMLIQSQKDSTILSQSGEPAMSATPETKLIKQNLVLLPIDVVSSEESYEDEYGAAIQSGLSKYFNVFYGADVERELEKEYSKLDCTAESCNQALAIAFNGELIADGSVSKVPGGYLLKLIITNVLTNKVIWSRTQPCEGCNMFKVIPALEELGKSVLIH